MIKLLDILENKILVPRRSGEERAKNYLIATQKKVQQYMKDGGKGNLNLNYTPITSLPSGLSVEGYLNLYNTPIKSLPSGLKVGESLYLDSSEITSLPFDLKVEGKVSLYHTPLSKSHTRAQIKQMAPGIKGYIYM